MLMIYMFIVVICSPMRFTVWWWYTSNHSKDIGNHNSSVYCSCQDEIETWGSLFVPCYPSSLPTSITLLINHSSYFFAHNFPETWPRNQEIYPFYRRIDFFRRIAKPFVPVEIWLWQPYLVLQVLKSDVEAALQVLNFAIYHKELTEMEEREQREMEMKQQADHDAGANDGTADGNGRWFYQHYTWSVHLS